ncbi:MAG: hypothetical protein ACM31L_20450 [Actinomycetota bacterium]
MSESRDRRGRRPSDADKAAADLRSQLVALKCDLQHFSKSHSSGLVTDSIRERIRQAEAQLASIEQFAVISVPAEQPDGIAVHASAPRFAPRIRR